MALTKVQGEGISGVSISANNEITMSSQPAFLAKLSSQQANIAVGSNTTIQFATEVFDQNTDFDTSNYTFTAPKTGRYQFNVNVLVTTLDSASSYYQLQLITSNRTYYHTVDPDFGQDNTYFNQDLSVLVDMDASDTAVVQILQASGTQQTDLDAVSTFSGFLAC